MCKLLMHNTSFLSIKNMSSEWPSREMLAHWNENHWEPPRTDSFLQSRLNAANSRLWETSRDLVKSYKIGWSLFPRKQFSVVLFWMKKYMYSKTSNIRRTWICNKIVRHSDVVVASPVGAVTTSSSSSSTWYLASMDWTKKTARRDKKHLKFGIWCVSY